MKLPSEQQAIRDKCFHPSQDFRGVSRRRNGALDSRVIRENREHESESTRGQNKKSFADLCGVESSRQSASVRDRRAKRRRERTGRYMLGAWHRCHQ